MNEGNAALDAGDRPGPAAISAWERAEGVLGVASKVVAMKVRASGEPTASSELSENPPSNSREAENWAREWATAGPATRRRGTMPRPTGSVLS